MPAPRFTPRLRNDRDAAGFEERWPSLQASFLDLLAECSMIVEHGRSEFDAARGLTYRVAEAVIIHFDDLLGRIPRNGRHDFRPTCHSRPSGRPATSCRMTTGRRGRRSSGTRSSTASRRSSSRSSTDEAFASSSQDHCTWHRACFRGRALRR